MRYLSLLFLLLAGVLPSAAQSAAELFVALPGELLPQIEVNRRKEMVTLFTDGRKDETENRLGGKSRINALTENFIEVQLSPAGTLQMRALPGPDSLKTVWVVFTAAGPARDSRVLCYNSLWEPVANGFRPPTPEAFIARKTNRKAKQACRETLNRIDFFPVEYRMDSIRPLIRAYQTLPDYLPEELYAPLKPCLTTGPLESDLNGKSRWRQE